MIHNFVVDAQLVARVAFLLLIVQVVCQDTTYLRQALYTLASLVDQTVRLALMKLHVYHALEVWY